MVNCNNRLGDYGGNRFDGQTAREPAVFTKVFIPARPVFPQERDVGASSMAHWWNLRILDMTVLCL